MSDCIDYDVKIVIGGPYNSGILRDLDGPVSYNYEPALQKLIEKAKKINFLYENSVPMKAAALQFVLHRSNNFSNTRSTINR